jgi:hypothetical protein
MHKILLHSCCSYWILVYFRFVSHFSIFHFVALRFVIFRFVSLPFVVFRFVSFRCVSISFRIVVQPMFYRAAAARCRQERKNWINNLEYNPSFSVEFFVQPIYTDYAN